LQFSREFFILVFVGKQEAFRGLEREMYKLRGNISAFEMGLLSFDIWIGETSNRFEDTYMAGFAARTLYDNAPELVWC
jgi:hypothetical protein